MQWMLDHWFEITTTVLLTIADHQQSLNRRVGHRVVFGADPTKFAGHS